MKQRIRILFTSCTLGGLALLSACGSSDKDENTSTATGTLTWTSDVAPVVKTNCAASGCHGTAGATSIIFENNEANFKSYKAENIRRLNLKSTDGDFMPQGGTITAADKKVLVDFLGQ